MLILGIVNYYPISSMDEAWTITEKNEFYNTPYKAIALNFQKNPSFFNITTNNVNYRRKLTFISFINSHVLLTNKAIFIAIQKLLWGNEVDSFFHKFIFANLGQKCLPFSNIM